MTWTVGELTKELSALGKTQRDRSVVVGGRWGVGNLSVAGPDSLGSAVELELEDLGLDDMGRTSLWSIIRYVGELPEYTLLPTKDRAALIAKLLPTDRDEARALALAAVDEL